MFSGPVVIVVIATILAVAVSRYLFETEQRPIDAGLWGSLFLLMAVSIDFFGWVANSL